MTFLWTTGGKERHGRFIYDNVILRYYIDGQTEPDLEFFQGAGAGSFIHLESQQFVAPSSNPSPHAHTTTTCARLPLGCRR